MKNSCKFFHHYIKLEIFHIITIKSEGHRIKLQLSYLQQETSLHRAEQIRMMKDRASKHLIVLWVGLKLHYSILMRGSRWFEIIGGLYLRKYGGTTKFWCYVQPQFAYNISEDESKEYIIDIKLSYDWAIKPARSCPTLHGGCVSLQSCQQSVNRTWSSQNRRWQNRRTIIE